MRDSTMPSAVPVRGAGAVAYYMDGLYAWPQSALSWFHSRGKSLVSITTQGAPAARVYDSEPMCYACVAQWAKARRQQYPHALPIVYLNRNEYATMRGVMKDHGLTLGKDWLVWLAAPGSQPGPYLTWLGVIAVQDEWRAQTGLSMDQSWVGNWRAFTR